MASAPDPVPGMRPEDLDELTWASDPRLSPDGTLVAYVVSGLDRERNEYRGRIWLAATDGSEPPRPFTSGPGRDSAPRWSPDGAHLAFLSTRDGGPAQLHVIPSGGGEARRLTDLPEDAGAHAWSPDGRRLAFCTRVRDPAYEEEDQARRAPRRVNRLLYKFDGEGWISDRRRHVMVVAADGSAPPVQVTDGDWDDDDPAWTPDGRLVFASGRDPDWDLTLVSDLWVVGAAGGEPERLTPGDGECAHPAPSPDGRLVAYLWVPGPWSDAPRHGRLAVVDLAAGERRVLAPGLDRQLAPYPPTGPPAWVDDGRLLVTLEDHGGVHLWEVAVDDSSPPAPVIAGELAVTRFDARAGRVAASFSTSISAGEVRVDGRVLTDVTGPFRAGRELVMPERFVATGPGGAEVDAWLVRPAGFAEGRRYPTLLSIHGGPATQYGSAFLDEFQVWAGAGYAVVYANPRGSTGAGETWTRAIRPAPDGQGLASVDYEDLMAVLDEALRRFPFLDGERLGVLGGSYGGYMTSWIVARTGRFRAAVSERSANHWPSMFGASDIGWVFGGYIGAEEWEDPEAWRRVSPTSHVTDIRTPLLILHSEDDLRCPVGQAEHLFTTLRLLGREVEMVRFPAEGHELSRSGSPVHRVMRFEIILEWFRRHLGDGAES